MMQVEALTSALLALIEDLYARTAWLRIHLAWMWSHLAVAWDEWHLARFHPLGPQEECARRLHRAARWREIRDRSF